MQVTDEMIERAQEAYSTYGQAGHLRASAPSAEVVKSMLTAALSDQQAVEVKARDIIDRSHTIVEDVLDMALYLHGCPRENIGKYQDAANRLAAFMNEVRSALVDVPAEPLTSNSEVSR